MFVLLMLVLSDVTMSHPECRASGSFSWSASRAGDRKNHKIYFYFKDVTRQLGRVRAGWQHSDFIGNRNNIYQNTLDPLSLTCDARKDKT